MSALVRNGRYYTAHCMGGEEQEEGRKRGEGREKSRGMGGKGERRGRGEERRGDGDDMHVHVCMSRLIARHSDTIPRYTPNANLIVAMVTISPGATAPYPLL